MHRFVIILNVITVGWWGKKHVWNMAAWRTANTYYL